MPTEIAVALVGLCGSAIGSLAGVVASAKLTRLPDRAAGEKSG